MRWEESPGSVSRWKPNEERFQEEVVIDYVKRCCWVKGDECRGVALGVLEVFGVFAESSSTGVVGWKLTGVGLKGVQERNWREPTETAFIVF